MSKGGVLANTYRFFSLIFMAALSRAAFEANMGVLFPPFVSYYCDEQVKKMQSEKQLTLREQLMASAATPPPVIDCWVRNF